MKTRLSALRDSSFVSGAPHCLKMYQIHQRICCLLTEFRAVFSVIIETNYPAEIRQLNPFGRHVAFCEAGSGATVTSLNLPPSP